jgi:phage shock protein C
MLGGVAGGIAEYFNIDASLIRIAFVAITLLGGSGVIAYFILWVILPQDNDKPAKTEDVIRENAEEIKDTMQSLAKNAHSDRSHLIWGGILIAFGVIFLLQNYGFMLHFNPFKLWPIILVVIGFSMLNKQKE